MASPAAPRLPLPTVLRHLAGSAWQMAGRLVAMASIAGFGLAVFVGALSAIDSIGSSRDAWYDEGHLADLELRVGAEDVANFPDLRSLPGVADSRLRLVQPVALRLASGASLRALLIMAATPGAMPINTLQIVRGSGLDPHDVDGAVVERSLARYHGVAVGDMLTVMLGGEAIRLRVRGIAADPEFLLAPANPLLFVPTKGSLGVLYVNPEVAEARFGFRPANSALLRFDRDAQADTVRSAVIERARTRLDVEWTAARNEQFMYRFLEKDTQVFRIIVPVIVLFSAVCAAFVTAFLFIRWVAHERQALAVFLALGHTRTEVAAGFAVLFALLAIGVVAEGLLLAPLIGIRFLEDFARSTGVPTPRFAFTLAHVVWGILGVVAIVGVAGAVAIARVFKLSPRDAMRHGIALSPMPDRVGGALGRLMPLVWLRLPLRSLFRHRLVSAISIVAVALGIGVTASFFIAYTSFVETTMTLVARNTWDCAVDFVAPMWEEDVARLTRKYGVTDYTPYTRGVAQLIERNERVNLYVGGFDPDQPWYAVTLVAGQGLSNSEAAGILLEQGTARELGVAVGDSVTIEVQGRRRTATIRGLFSGSMPGEARFTLAFHRELADLPERATGIFLRATEQPAALASRISADADVQQVLTKELATSAILSVSEQVTGIIRLGQALSLVIVALSVFASVGYTVLLREGEYQTLRVLGYGDGLITGIVMVEIGFIGAAALVLATPIGIAAATYYNAQLSHAWFQIDTIFHPADFARAFVPGYILLLLVAIPTARIVVRTPLSSVVRSHEIA
jgi:putative ABC transport system permease protein